MPGIEAHDVETPFAQLMNPPGCQRSGFDARWMALDTFVLFPGESIATRNHSFQMQIGMIVGFVTSYSANVFLLKNGLKEAM